MEKVKGVFRASLAVTGFFILAITFLTGPLALGLCWADEQKEVRKLLEQKGKVPWLERDLGYGVVSLQDGAMLRENFNLLDSYEAHTDFKINDFMPEFMEGYNDQENKPNKLSRALEKYLKSQLPYTFKALAGENRVDVVNLKEGGNEAYVFIIIMSEEGFIKINQSEGTFYYDVPTVMKALEKFAGAHQEIDKIIWLDRGEGYFMFIIQKCS